MLLEVDYQNLFKTMIPYLFSMVAIVHLVGFSTSKLIRLMIGRE